MIEAPHNKFLVFEAPNDANLPLYVDELKRHQCATIVRACDGSYSDEVLQAAGIAVHELTFPDGTAPPDAVVDKFLKLLASLDKSAKANAAASSDGGAPPGGKPCVAVHCVAGLGRAPVLVAIAMIEGGMDPLEVIKEIRAKRPGALNVVQLKYLQQYKRRGGKTCVIQ